MCIVFLVLSNVQHEVIMKARQRRTALCKRIIKESRSYSIKEPKCADVQERLPLDLNTRQHHIPKKKTGPRNTTFKCTVHFVNHGSDDRWQ